MERYRVTPEKKTKSFTMRMTPKEQQLLWEAAALNRMTLCAYLIALVQDDVGRIKAGFGRNCSNIGQNWAYMDGD